jgi:hypothetical protein
MNGSQDKERHIHFFFFSPETFANAFFFSLAKSLCDVIVLRENAIV